MIKSQKWKLVSLDVLCVPLLIVVKSTANFHLFKSRQLAELNHVIALSGSTHIRAQRYVSSIAALNISHWAISRNANHSNSLVRNHNPSTFLCILMIGLAFTTLSSLSFVMYVYPSVTMLDSWGLEDILFPWRTLFRFQPIHATVLRFPELRVSLHSTETRLET